MIRALAFAAMMLVSSAACAWALPTEGDLNAYVAREQLYVTMGQTPDQVAVSLKNYFGKSIFYVNTRGTVKLADILIVFYDDEGHITYMTTLDTMVIKQ